MSKLLDNALTQLQSVIAELNTDQTIIDLLSQQLADVQKESTLDYLRGKGRAIREGSIIITSSQSEKFYVDSSIISESDELALVIEGYTKAGFIYSAITNA